MKVSLLPRSEKKITPIGVDLFLMEMLFKNEKVNLPAIIFKHMNYYHINTKLVGLGYRMVS